MPQGQDLVDTPYAEESASDFSRGVVDSVETHLIPEGAAEYLLNVEADFVGRARKTSGVKTRGSHGTDEPTGMAAFESLGFSSVIVTAGNKTWSTPGDGLFYRRASGVSIYPTDVQLTQGQGATNSATLFFANCVPYSANASLPFGNLVALDKAWGFTEITDIRPRSVVWYQGRLWAFNSCHTLHGQDFLLWSDILDGRSWSNGQSVQVDRESGDPGVAIVPLRGDNPQLLLFKENSIHRLDIFWATDGFLPATANTLDFTTAKLTQIVKGTGAIATRGITWVPGLQGADILFLSRDGIRSLSRSQTDAQGGAGPPLSERIQNTIDRINWDRADRAVAGYFDNKAYFAVPVDGSEVNNFIIAYDTTRNQFSFFDRPVNGFAVSKIDGRSTKFFSTYATSGTDGNSTVSLVNGYHTYEWFNGNAGAFGEAQDFDVRTRAFTFGASDPNDNPLGHRKVWRMLITKWKAGATGATMLVQYRVDDTTSWVTLDNVYLDPSDAYPILPVTLPFTFDSGKIVPKVIGLHDVPSGYKLQVRFRDTTGFARQQLLAADVFAHRQPVKFELR